MVRISAKNQTFTMGLDKSNAPLQGNGQPWSCYLGVHQVTFTYDFCMDAYLVTQSQFLAVMGFNPSKHQIAGATGGTLPVDSATWFDAMIYCNTRSQADGLAPAYSYGAVTHSGTGSLYGGGPPTTTDPKSASNVAGVVMDLTKPGYRLPTNAEYEYAERANTTGNYFFAPDGANVSQVAQQYGWGPDNSGGTTHPVGLLKPNPWGLYDIVGNLFEWENDWDAPYPTTPQVDPVGEPAGASCGGATPAGGAKMAKGGSFKADVGNHQRIGYHYYWTPASVNGELGLRCVATVVP
jgi:formylglycine-generating enzyme required for sulfatase activity